MLDTFIYLFVGMFANAMTYCVDRLHGRHYTKRVYGIKYRLHAQLRLQSLLRSALFLPHSTVIASVCAVLASVTNSSS